MRRLAILVLAVAAALSGCRKKTAPEFYELESSYSIMVARDGDDAYASEEMDRVLEGLKKIPADAVEGPRASSLVTTITTERARVAREAQEREAALAAAEQPSQAPPSGPSLFEPIKAPAPAAGADGQDAGAIPTRPWGGMTEAELQKHFGSCFTAGPPKTIPGHPEGSSFRVNDDAACRQKFGSTDPNTSTFLVFVKDALIGQTTEQKTVIPGKPPPPGPPVYVDAGSFLAIPGAPVPEGYPVVPGAPPGAPQPPPPPPP
ncbi:MAG: hypothetical protein AB1938_16125 [Myxococcota bacterium]